MPPLKSPQTRQSCLNKNNFQSKLGPLQCLARVDRPYPRPAPWQSDSATARRLHCPPSSFTPPPHRPAGGRRRRRDDVTVVFGFGGIASMAN